MVVSCRLFLSQKHFRSTIRGFAVSIHCSLILGFSGCERQSKIAKAKDASQRDLRARENSNAHKVKKEGMCTRDITCQYGRTCLP